MMNSLLPLLKRCFRDIIAPNRFGFHPSSISEAGRHGWLYSLGFKRTGMIEAYNLQKDSDGIVMMQHYLDRNDYYYSPVKIAHYALASWNDCLLDNQEPDKDFWTHIDWLRTNGTSTSDSIIFWKTPTTNPRYNLKAGYISAIVQGLVLSALARAYVIRPEPSIMNEMNSAIRLFYIPVEKGGIMARFQNEMFYEEYPCIPYSHVVNGFLFALNGLWDSQQVGCIKAEELVRSGLATLKTIIPFWIQKHWSYYDLRYLYNEKLSNWSTRHYQYLHADQITFIYEATKDLIFAKAKQTLLRQAGNPFAWFKAYFNKAKALISFYQRNSF